MPKPPLLERAIGAISPKWAAERATFRAFNNGRPTASASPYSGAVQTRLDRSWSPTIGYFGANAPLNRVRHTKLRDRARDLDRNNCLASGMLDRCVENVVGRGFAFRPTTADEEFNKQAKDLWERTKDTLDLRGMSSFAKLQALIFRSYLLDGDIGVGLVRQGNAPKLQIFESPEIDTQYGGYDLKNRVFEGIQYDSAWRPLFFNTVSMDSAGLRQSNTPIPANDFIFYARRKTQSQNRGEPIMAQNYSRFDQLDGFIDAVVVAGRVAAQQALVITSDNSTQRANSLPQALNAQAQLQKLQTVEPGSALYLNSGEKAQGFNPTQPAHNFPDFVAAMLRIMGAPLGLPLELVLLDFSRTNYSSARASLLQAYRTFQTHQQNFIETFHSRVYRWVLSKAVKSGQLVVPDDIRDSFWDHKWTPPGWAWVDPVKELQAASIALDLGLDTMSGIAHQYGREWEDLFAQRAIERERAAELELPDIRSTLTRDPVAPGKTLLVPGAAGALVDVERDDEEDDDPADDNDDEASDAGE